MQLWKSRLGGGGLDDLAKFPYQAGQIILGDGTSAQAFSLATNANIPSGVTLEIKPKATLTIDPAKALTVQQGATLTVLGACSTNAITNKGTITLDGVPGGIMEHAKLTLTGTMDNAAGTLNLKPNSRFEYKPTASATLTIAGTVNPEAGISEGSVSYGPAAIDTSDTITIGTETLTSGVYEYNAGSWLKK